MTFQPEQNSFEGRTIDDFATVVNQNQIALVDHAEGDAKGVDPEAVRLDRISQSDMARNALIKA